MCICIEYDLDSERVRATVLALRLKALCASVKEARRKIRARFRECMSIPSGLPSETERESQAVATVHHHPSMSVFSNHFLNCDLLL